METIVDQLKTVNSKSFLEEVKNPENINNLILKNFNNETNWDEISKFTQLNKIQLENCLIDNNIFSEGDFCLDLIDSDYNMQNNEFNCRETDYLIRYNLRINVADELGAGSREHGFTIENSSENIQWKCP